MKTWLLIIGIVVLAAKLVVADSKPSADWGRELFNKKTLGTNGKSCASCHPDGKGLEEAAAYDAAKLEKVTNQCISMALKGSALPSGSSDLASLVLYLKTLAPASAP